MDEKEIENNGIEQSYLFDSHLIIKKIQKVEQNSIGRSQLLIQVLSPKYSESEVFSGTSSNEAKSKIKELAAEIDGFELTDNDISNEEKRKKKYDEIVELLSDEKKIKKYEVLKEQRIINLLPKTDLYESNAFSNPNETFCKTLKRSFVNTLSKDSVKEKA
ncbi:MAG: hypothetical protein ACTSSL_12240, partial [Candidatus Heimdallarchaeaceae archaeon]